MIVRDEERHLSRCLDSIAQHVDEIIIVDTGSVDRTKQIAADYGACVVDCNPATHPQFFFDFDGKVCLGDFAGARNVSYAHATKDFVMWLDADAVVDGAYALRAVLPYFAARQRQFDVVDTICENLVDGESVRWWRERITRRGKFRWTCPVHEYIDVRDDRRLALEGVVIRHMREGDSWARARLRYRALMRRYLATHPNDERMLYLLARCLLITDRDEAIKILDRVTALGRSAWAAEARAQLRQLQAQPQPCAR